LRPIQKLYYDHGQLHCPVHGGKYVRFLTDDSNEQSLHWCCTALLPDGSHCLHSAAWRSLADIQDSDLEILTVAHLHGQFNRS
jgi:hypothetical protein